MSAPLVAMVVVSLFLEPSELAEQLRPMLAEELGEEMIVASREQATMALSLALMNDGAELALVLVRVSGETILERKIAIASDNRKAALRIAAVAIEEAITAELELREKNANEAVSVSTGSVAEARIEEPPAGPRVPAGVELSPVRGAGVARDVVTDPPFELWLGAAGGAAWIGGPQMIFEITGRHPIAFFEAGVAFSSTGLAGVALQESLMNGQPGLTGRVRVFEALALFAWTPLATTVFDLELQLGVEAGGGASFQSLEADPEAFLGASPARTGRTWGPAARASAVLVAAIGPAVRARLAAGSAVRPVLRAELPEGFPLGSATLESGPVSAYIAIGVELSPF